MISFLTQVEDDEGRLITTRVTFGPASRGWPRFLKNAAKRALNNKKRQATACYGALVVEVLNKEQDPRQGNLFKE